MLRANFAIGVKNLQDFLSANNMLSIALALLSVSQKPRDLTSSGTQAGVSQFIRLWMMSHEALFQKRDSLAGGSLIKWSMNELRV
jgi:hypothetical protein